MIGERKQGIVGVGLVVVGTLFLFVTNHIIIGWRHIWPLFPIAAGVLMLRAFRSKGDTTLLFAGLVGTLLGAFLLLFSVGMLEWGIMDVLWPTIPLIVGGALIASNVVRKERGTMLLEVAVVLFALVAFLFTTERVDPRVAAPFVRFWPLVLVVAGIVILKIRGERLSRGARTPDPGMEAVRAEMRDPDGRSGRASEELEASILRDVAQAGGPKEAGTALAGRIEAAFPRVSWVGVYRLEGDELTLEGDEYAGKPPEHARIPVAEGICGAAAAEKRTIVVPDVTLDSRYLACSAAVKSEIVIPIVAAGGELVGVLDVDSDEVDGFKESDRRFLEALVAKAARYLKSPESAS